MDKKIREPKQTRSLEKKRRIIEAGYELFAEKGYLNTNTAEIAKKAEVSVGLVYGYFKDKRDILLDVLDIYIERVFEPIISMFEQISSPLNFERMINHIVDKAVELHKNNSLIHETLYSMTYIDDVFRERFLMIENKMTKKIVEAIKKTEYCPIDLEEKVHLSFEIIQSYAHECVYDHHEYLNYKYMRENIVKMLSSIFIA